MLATVALVLYAGRDLTFYVDEWGYIESRRVWDLDAFLQPANGHVSIVLATVFKTLFATVGIAHYLPYRAAAIVVHLICVAFVYWYARRRVGSLGGVVAAVVVLLLGAGWEVLLWPINLIIPAALAAGIGALIAVERDDRLGDAVAAGLLTLSLFSGGVGLAFVVAVMADVVLRRQFLRRAAVVEIPVGLYVLWYLVYGQTYSPGGSISSNLPRTPGYVFHSAAAAVGAVSGLAGQVNWHRNPPGASALLVGVLAALGFVAVRRRRLLFPRFFALASGLLAFWILTALTRAGLHNEAVSHYLYVDGVFVVLLSVELLRRVRFPVAAAVAGAIVLSAALALNLHRLFEGAEYLRSVSSSVSAELGALELVGAATADPVYRPDPVHMPDVFAILYLDTVRELGSPADTPREIAQKREPEREAADRVLIEALRIAPEHAGARLAAPRGPSPDVDRVEGGNVRREGGCVVLAMSSASPTLELATASDLALRPRPGSTVSMQIRRFADSYESSPTIEIRSPVKVPLPTLRDRQTWHVRLSGALTGLQVCGLAA